MNGHTRLYRRKSKERGSPITYCIVVEGEKTENNYFRDAKREFEQIHRDRMLARQKSGQPKGVMVALNIVVGHGRSFENVIRKALDQAGLGYERIWCVVDADVYSRLAGEYRKGAVAIYNKAVTAGIDVIFSRPCFEVWYRHHFNADSSELVDGDRAKSEIRRLWPQYQQKPDRHWELLRDRLCAALTNAEAVRRAHRARPVEDCDASTDVDWLIYELFCQIDPNDPTTR